MEDWGCLVHDTHVHADTNLHVYLHNRADGVQQLHRTSTMALRLGTCACERENASFLCAMRLVYKNKTERITLRHTLREVSPFRVCGQPTRSRIHWHVHKTSLPEEVNRGDTSETRTRKDMGKMSTNLSMGNYCASSMEMLGRHVFGSRQLMVAKINGG